MKIQITEIEQLPSKLSHLILKEARDEEITLDTLDELIEYIRETGDNDESKDYSYIYNTYSIQIGDWKLSAFGSSYLKDHSICDEQMSEEIEIENMEIARQEKLKKKEDMENNNKNSWTTFVNSKSKDEILEFLINNKVKFPY